MLAETPKEHRDYEDLVQVHKQVKEIVRLINERTRQVENIEGLSKVQERYQLSSIGLDIVARDRWMAQEKQVIVSKNGKPFKGQSVALLLNDELILLREDKQQHALLCRIPIALADLSPIPNNELGCLIVCESV